jgi:hypothetical protein
MRRHWLDVAVLFVLSSGTCTFVSLAVPGERTIAIHVYFLFLGALLTLVIVSSVAAAAPRARRSDLASALDERPERARQVPQLAKVDREVTLALGNAYDLHSRLCRICARSRPHGSSAVAKSGPGTPAAAEPFGPTGRNRASASRRGIPEHELRGRRRPGADLVELTEVARVASAVIDGSRRRSSGSVRRSSFYCSACSPTGTCCSRTFLGWRRR